MVVWTLQRNSCSGVEYRFEVLLRDKLMELQYKNVSLCLKATSCSQVFYAVPSQLPLRIFITAVGSQDEAAGITFTSEYIGEHFLKLE